MKLLLVALNASYPHTNLALRQIRAKVPETWECELMERHINLPRAEIFRDIVRRQADCVGFSCYLWNRDMAMKLGAAVKRACPGVFVYFGGPEAENDPVPFLSCGDAVSRGEGEASIAALLAGVETGDFSRVAGLFMRGVDNPVAPPIPVEEWSDPYAREMPAGRIVYVETSRGCPYRCAYCLSAGDRVRAMSAEEAVKRLTRLADGGVELIKLVDRTFNFDRVRAAAIWQGLIDHALAKEAESAGEHTHIRLGEGRMTRYHFEIAANLLDEEGMAVLARAPKGLFQLEAGIQSTNEETLAAVGRGASTAEIMDKIKRVIALGTIPVHVDLIAGLPCEDLASFGRSFDETWALGADMLQLGFLKVLPGSRMRREAEKFSLVFDPAAPYEVVRTPWLSCSELCFLHDVEKVTDWYDGKFSVTMRRLSEEEGAFHLRCGLARFLREEGAFDRDLTAKDRAYLLYRFRPEMRDLIAHDMLLRGASLPPELDVVENDELRALLRAHFHPIRGQRARAYEQDPRPGYAPCPVVLLYSAGGAAPCTPAKGTSPFGIPPC